jgi:transposase
VSSDDTTILFGLPGVRVAGVVRAAGGTRVVHVLTDDDSAAACLCCGVLSTAVRQRRTTCPRDVPYGQERLRVRWHKVQYACREEPCPRKAFTEAIGEVPAGARVTGRLRRHVAVRVGQGLAVSVAGDGLLSWPVANAAWVEHAEGLLAEPEPVGVLGIDETRCGRARWSFDEVRAAG